MPPADASHGKRAADLASLTGLDLLAWQRDVLLDILRVRPDGRWAARSAALIVPRQNGKSIVLEALALEWMFLSRVPLVTWTAHEFQTAKENFRHLRGLIEATPRLKREIAPNGFRVGNGDLGIELKSGQRLRFLARTGGGGRGFSGDGVILDEAYALTRDQMAALLPTMRARPNPMTVLASSAPKAEQEILPALMLRCRAGEAPEICYHEWSTAEPTEPGVDIDLDDPLLVAEANPSLGYLIDIEGIQSDRSLMAGGDEEYARETLGLIGGGRAVGVIDAALWSSLGEVSATTSRPVFAVDVTPDGLHTTVAVCGRRPDGLRQVEIVRHEPGTGWVTDWLAERCRKWKTSVLLNPASMAGSLLPGLKAAKVPVKPVTAREMAQACGGFVAETVERRLRHLDDPILTDSVAAGRKRPLNDAWAWRMTAEAVPLVAATLAVYGQVAAAAKPPAAPTVARAPALSETNVLVTAGF